MPSELRILQIRIVLPFLIVGLMAVGVWLSISMHDPHWLNRSGAAIAAVAAGAILLQIRVEVKIEDRRKKLQEEAARTEEVDRSTPVGALEAKLAATRIERRHEALTTTRLMVAAYVVGCAMIGELLHGFGDLLMCSILAVCAAH